MIQACKNALTLSRSDLDFIRLHEESFAACPADSIDFAVMEKTDRLCVVTMDAGWSDQGSWATLHATGEKDSHDNVCVGDVAAFNSSGNYLHSSGRLLMAVGVENAVVVETPDAVLVASNDHSQELKSAVESLRQNGRVEAVAHPLTRRPWGSFQSMDKGERFQVKRITVKPGEILSLQKHRHRAEHWVVVKGVAQVVNGDREMILRENESTYIPVGSVHRLGNPGETPLELIEVQTGSYLGEDDIIRLEDKYNRDSD